jgi:putative hydroxymethylpyrimidine transport system substrate-binding protein
MLKKVDVGADMMRNVEPVVLQHHGFASNMFCAEDVGFPPYSELIYIASTGPTPEKINLFLQAVSDATQTLEKDPNAAWQALIKSYPKLNTEINSAIWQKTYSLFAANPGQV